MDKKFPPFEWEKKEKMENKPAVATKPVKPKEKESHFAQVFRKHTKELLATPSVTAHLKRLSGEETNREVTTVAKKAGDGGGGREEERLVNTALRAAFTSPVIFPDDTPLRHPHDLIVLQILSEIMHKWPGAILAKNPSKRGYIVTPGQESSRPPLMLWIPQFLSELPLLSDNSESGGCAGRFTVEMRYADSLGQPAHRVQMRFDTPGADSLGRILRTLTTANTFRGIQTVAGVELRKVMLLLKAVCLLDFTPGYVVDTFFLDISPVKLRELVTKLFPGGVVDRFHYQAEGGMPAIISSAYAASGTLSGGVRSIAARVYSSRQTEWRRYLY